MSTVGLQIPSFSFGGPPGEIFDHVAELARAADESGFSSLWVMDHLNQLDPLGGPDEPMLEAYTLLGALAAVTSRVTLGTLVTGVTYRNPGLLAKMVITLDVISGGRAVLGIGAAWHEPEHRAFAFDYPPIGERLDMLEEALQICRAMFREDGVSLEGAYFAVRDVRVVPRPVRPGGPPILVGGGGERRTLKLVARYADACNIFGDAATVRHKVEVLHRHCADAGRDPAEIQVTRLGTLMFTDTAQEAEERRRMIASVASPEMAAALVVGNDEQVLEQVHELVEAGAQELIFNMPGAPAEHVRRAGALLGAGVA